MKKFALFFLGSLVGLCLCVGCADPLAPDEDVRELVEAKTSLSKDITLTDSSGSQLRARIYYNEAASGIAEVFDQVATVVTDEEIQRLKEKPGFRERRSLPAGFEPKGAPDARFYVKIEDQGDGVGRAWAAPFAAIGWESEDDPVGDATSADEGEHEPRLYSAQAVVTEGYAVWTSGNHTWTFNAIPCFDDAIVDGDTNFVSARGTIRLRDEGTDVDTQSGIGPGADAYLLSDSNNSSDEWSIRSSCTSSCGSFNHAGEFICKD